MPSSPTRECRLVANAGQFDALQLPENDLGQIADHAAVLQVNGVGAVQVLKHHVEMRLAVGDDSRHGGQLHRAFDLDDLVFRTRVGVLDAVEAGLLESADGAEQDRIPDSQLLKLRTDSFAELVAPVKTEDDDASQTLADDGLAARWAHRLGAACQSAVGGARCCAQRHGLHEIASGRCWLHDSAPGTERGVSCGPAALGRWYERSRPTMS